MIVAEHSRLAGLGYRIEVGSDILEFLVRAGYHRMLGARSMRATVERHLQEMVAHRLLSLRTSLSGRQEKDTKMVPGSEGN